ncbi:MAG: tRNA-dihydrouridine synthase [Clostridiales bacterium]|nr:tRNA-dihydrouridine synthase [Clostridiales bacterium]
MLKIGKYDIAGAILAPMAGYTDVAFRTLCRECGAGLTVTEMVSVRGLVHDSQKTEQLMRLSEIERPSCIQLFGNDPADFATVAKTLSCDIIDINMGCPMPKIVKNGDGAALLNDPERAGRIVRAIKDVTDKPVTVKTRLGYHMDEHQAAALIDSVARAGAAAVAVHGRYADQRYMGFSDSGEVVELAKNSPIPIILNGDIGEVFPPSRHIAALMIGRQALFNPHVFDDQPAEPFGTARRHIELLTKYFDERYTINQTRKFFVHYFRRVNGSKALRNAVNIAQSVSEVQRAIDECEKLNQ